MNRSFFSVVKSDEEHQIYIARGIRSTPFSTRLDIIADPNGPCDLFGMFRRAKPETAFA